MHACMFDMRYGYDTISYDAMRLMVEYRINGTNVFHLG